MSLYKQLVSRGTAASQNAGEQMELTSNIVHSKICHDDRGACKTYINFMTLPHTYYMVFFCHREVGYIDTALRSQHNINLT